MRRRRWRRERTATPGCAALGGRWSREELEVRPAWRTRLTVRKPRWWKREGSRRRRLRQHRLGSAPRTRPPASQAHSRASGQLVLRGAPAAPLAARSERSPTSLLLLSLSAGPAASARRSSRSARRLYPTLPTCWPCSPARRGRTSRGRPPLARRGNFSRAEPLVQPQKALFQLLCPALQSFWAEPTSVHEGESDGLARAAARRRRRDSLHVARRRTLLSLRPRSDERSSERPSELARRKQSSR